MLGGEGVTESVERWEEGDMEEEEVKGWGCYKPKQV